MIFLLILIFISKMQIGNDIRMTVCDIADMFDIWVAIAHKILSGKVENETYTCVCTLGWFTVYWLEATNNGVTTSQAFLYWWKSGGYRFLDRIIICDEIFL